MKKTNKFLIIGLAIFLSILILFVFKDYLVTNDPYMTYSSSLRKVIVDSKVEYLLAPFSPDSEFPMGSDVLGRDIFSRILYGFEFTMKIAILATMLKFINSLISMFIYSIGFKYIRGFTQLMRKVFTNVPSLILLFLILSLKKVANLEIEVGILVFAFFIAFIEGFRLTDTLLDKYDEIYEKPFIVGQKSIGKSNLSIFIQNIIPHMVSTMTILFFLELSRSLLMIAQLGLLGAFVGKNKIDEMNFREMGLFIKPEYYPEWGGMLANSRFAIAAGRYWIIFYPAFAFFITILSLNLIAEGIKIELEKKRSHFIVNVKKFLRFFSISEFIMELKNIRRRYKSISLKLLTVLLICFFIYQLNFSTVDYERDNVENALSLIHTKEEFVEYINDYFNKNNYLPINQGTYEIEYTSEYFPNENSNIVMESEEFILKYPEDFDFGKVYVDLKEFTVKIGTVLGLKSYSPFYSENFIAVDNSDSIETLDQVLRDRAVIGVIKPKTQKSDTLDEVVSKDYYNASKIRESFTPYEIFVNDDIYTKLLTMSNELMVLKNLDNKEVLKNYGYRIYKEGFGSKSVYLIHEIDFNDQKSLTEAIFLLDTINKIINEKGTLKYELINIFVDIEGAKEVVSQFRAKLTDKSLVINTNGILGKNPIVNISQLKTNTETEYRKVKELINESKKYNVEMKETSILEMNDTLETITMNSNASGIKFDSDDEIDENSYNLMYWFLEMLLKGE